MASIFHHLGIRLTPSNGLNMTLVTSVMLARSKLSTTRLNSLSRGPLLFFLLVGLVIESCDNINVRMILRITIPYRVL
jgi:hypothetical protein